MLSQRVRYMETHESIYYATARGQSFYINKNGNRILGRMWGEYCEDDLLQCFLETNYSFSVWNNIYRADFVKRFVFDEEVKVYQDFDFIVRILLQNYKHGFIKDSKVDYLYRQGHSGTITSTFISSEKYNSTKYLFEKISELISNVSDEKKYKAAFFKFYLLQYERVLIYGTKEQCLDYYEFITKRYSYKYNRRLKLTKKLVEIRQKESLTSRKVRIVLYMLFDYKKIIDWINQKLRYRTFNI